MRAIPYATGPALVSVAAAWVDPKTVYVVTWKSECEHSCQGFVETIENRDLDAEVILRLAGQDKSALPGCVGESRALGADLVAT